MDPSRVQYAAIWGSPDFFRNLICEQGNRRCVNTSDNFGVTPLHAVTRLRRSVSAHQLENIKCLLEHGADVNAADINGNTPLHTAVYIDQADVVEVLLAHPKIDIHILNNNLKTPFQDTGVLISAMLWLRGAKYTGHAPSVSAVWDIRTRHILELERLGLHEDILTTLLFHSEYELSDNWRVSSVFDYVGKLSELMTKALDDSPPSLPPPPPVDAKMSTTLCLHCVDTKGVSYTVDVPPAAVDRSAVLKEIDSADSADVPIHLPFDKPDVEFAIRLATIDDPLAHTNMLSCDIQSEQQAIQVFKFITHLDMTDLIQPTFNEMSSRVMRRVSAHECVSVETRMDVLARYPIFVRKIEQDAGITRM
jgi:Ankyrin repeats (3 copies)